MKEGLTSLEQGMQQLDHLSWIKYTTWVVASIDTEQSITLEHGQHE